jgi:hypothetical protein
MPTCGIILPLTARSSGGSPEERKEQALELLRGFGSNISDHCASQQLQLYVGVDAGDWYSTQQGQQAIGDILQQHHLRHTITVFEQGPGRICSIWQVLASRAYEDGLVRLSREPPLVSGMS